MHKKSKIITMALGGLLIASSLGINNLAKADNFEFEVGTGNLNNTIENSAKVGSKLPKPEKGWKRYDDTSKKISYVGSWELWSNYTQWPIYNKTCHGTGSGGQKIKFNFTGSKLRLISFAGPDRGANLKILIDNKEYTFNTRTSSHIPTYLSFEKNDLENTEHTVEIISGSGRYSMTLDAIDIAENAELKAFGEVEDNRPPLFLNKTNLNLSVYQSDILTANFAPSEGNELKGVKWSSSNPSVATVDHLGKVNAVSVGTTTITAELEDGSAKPAKCEVTVK